MRRQSELTYWRLTQTPYNYAELARDDIWDETELVPPLKHMPPLRDSIRDYMLASAAAAALQLRRNDESRPNFYPDRNRDGRFRGKLAALPAGVEAYDDRRRDF